MVYSGSGSCQKFRIRPDPDPTPDPDHNTDRYSINEDVTKLLRRRYEESNSAVAEDTVATKATAAKRGRISSPKAKENSFTRKMKERRRHVDEASPSSPPSPSAPLLPRRKPTGGSPPPRTSLEIKLHERYENLLWILLTL
jgi:hypothetical protein